MIRFHGENFFAKQKVLSGKPSCPDKMVMKRGIRQFFVVEDKKGLVIGADLENPSWVEDMIDAGLHNLT